MSDGQSEEADFEDEEEQSLLSSSSVNGEMAHRDGHNGADLHSMDQHNKEKKEIVKENAPEE